MTNLMAVFLAVLCAVPALVVVIGLMRAASLTDEQAMKEAGVQTEPTSAPMKGRDW
jgi:uncharacterized membrane protein